ncbi:unnamed protein product [Lathyrus sativus]|nr:unnamed protein product [Lathyrus sativus]
MDIISAIEFDKSGDHLATADRGGRVVLFEQTGSKDQHGSRKDLESTDYSNSRHPEFHYKTEFQSHEPEFDYLKSLEIEDKINKIKWCQTANWLINRVSKALDMFGKIQLRNLQMDEFNIQCAFR